jgi:hypothetical protein
MTKGRFNLPRRSVLQSAAGLLAASVGSIGGVASASEVLSLGNITGKGIGDFDFLTGEWKIKIRKFDTSGPDGKSERDASATVHRVLGGAGSIEELRKGDGSLWGMGVRVWRPETKRWADHWTSAEDGVVNQPQLGQFIDGAGVFLLDDTEDGKPVKIRAFWDEITPNSCRWYQTMSKDGGATWERSTYMAWTRA